MFLLKKVISVLEFCHVKVQPPAQLSPLTNWI